MSILSYLWIDHWSFMRVLASAWRIGESINIRSSWNLVHSSFRGWGIWFWTPFWPPDCLKPHDRPSLKWLTVTLKIETAYRHGTNCFLGVSDSGQNLWPCDSIVAASASDGLRATAAAIGMDFGQPRDGWVNGKEDWSCGRAFCSMQSATSSPFWGPQTITVVL